jgi:hypothetical protein
VLAKDLGRNLHRTSPHGTSLRPDNTFISTLLASLTQSHVTFVYAATLARSTRFAGTCISQPLRTGQAVGHFSSNLMTDMIYLRVERCKARFGKEYEIGGSFFTEFCDICRRDVSSPHDVRRHRYHHPKS